MLLLCNRPDMSQTQWEGCKFSCRALQMSLHSQISPYLVLARAPVLLSLSLDTSVAWLWNMWKLWMFIPDLDSGNISLSNSDVPWNSLACSTRCALPAFLPHLEAANITYKYWIKEGLQCCPVFFFAGDLTNCTSRSPWLIKTSSCASGEWPSSLQPWWRGGRGGSRRRWRSLHECVAVNGRKRWVGMLSKAQPVISLPVLWGSLLQGSGQTGFSCLSQLVPSRAHSCRKALSHPRQKHDLPGDFQRKLCVSSFRLRRLLKNKPMLCLLQNSIY